MNLQYLKYALEVEKAGSISKAAENLYMNQPNLSKAIKELESTIGVSLFERTTKGVSAITEDGRVFLAYAKNILAQFEDMQAHFKSENQKKPFRITIPHASYITEAFTEMVKGIGDREDFYFSLQEANFIQSVKNVAQDGYNLGVIRYRTRYEKHFLSHLEERELAYKEILRADSLVILNERHPLAKKTALKFSDLGDMIEIYNDDFALPQQFSIQQQLSVPQPFTANKPSPAFAHQSRKQIHVFERGSLFDMLSHIPDAFAWVSPMPYEVLARNGLVQKKCAAKDIRFKDVLIYRHGYAFGEWDNIFFAQLEKAIQKILPDEKNTNEKITESSPS